MDRSAQLMATIIRFLRADQSIQEAVGNRVYGPEVLDREWPHIRYGASVVENFEATGWKGGDHEITLHAFAKGPAKNVSNLASTIVEVLDDAPLAIEMTGIDWVRTTILQDSQDTEGYHAVITFSCATVR